MSTSHGCFIASFGVQICYGNRRSTSEFDETLKAPCFAFHATNVDETLGGGLKDFLFSSKFQEKLIQFDEHIFQMSGKKPPTR